MKNSCRTCTTEHDPSLDPCELWCLRELRTGLCILRMQNKKGQAHGPEEIQE